MSGKPEISRKMTVLEAVAAYPVTEEYFRSLDGLVGECVLCQSLFETLEGLSDKYGLDLDRILSRVSALANQ